MVFQSSRARTPRFLIFLHSTIFSSEKVHFFYLKEIFYPLSRRSFLYFSSFSFNENSFLISVEKNFSLSFRFHFLFRNKFFLLSQRRFLNFFFLRFFTSLKSVVPLFARSLISDETAQSRSEGLFSYKGNQTAIQMRQFRFHRQFRRSWRGLLMIPICRLHVLMFLL